MRPPVLIAALLLGLLVVGCALPGPIEQARPTDPVEPSPTPARGAPDPRPYVSDDGGFTLPLPAGWIVGEPRDTPLGREQLVGLAPLVEGSSRNSVIYVADTRSMYLEKAIDLLCGDVCSPQAEIEEITLDGRPAWRAALGATAETVDQPSFTWYFVDNGDRFVFFNLHDPDTLAPLDDVIGAMTFTPVVEVQARADAAGQVARQLLQRQLQLDPEQIEIVSVELAEWPDTCLGLPAGGEFCSQATTLGFRVTLAAGGEQYRYRTDLEASEIRLSAAPEPQIGQTADDPKMLLSWQSPPALESPCQAAILGRERLAVGLCGGPMLAEPYSSEMRPQQLQEFVQTYAGFEAATTAGQVALSGQGPLSATPAEERMLAEWAALVWQEAGGDAAPFAGESWPLAFTWHREGGFAGFCDDLVALVTGELAFSNCQGAPPQDVSARFMTADELAQLYAWRERYAGFEWERTDPAKADAMTIRLRFVGQGQEEADASAQAALADFAAQLLARWAEETAVPYVDALEDVPMLAGPGAESYERVGEVFAGQAALVTGVSRDGQWWRVVCPDDTRGNCWLSADPTLTRPSSPPGATGLWPLDQGDRRRSLGIYAAVIRQVYTVDHTFGAAPNFPVIYLMKQPDQAADSGLPQLAPQPALAGEPIPASVREGIVAALAELPARFVWVESLEEVPQDEYDMVQDGGAVIMVGEITPVDEPGPPQVHVPASIYVAPLVAGGQTYVLEQVDGVWRITGTTGPMWIS